MSLCYCGSLINIMILFLGDQSSKLEPEVEKEVMALKDYFVTRHIFVS